MPPHLQVKLLHVLEDRCVQPLGSERTIPIDVRIMAATNKNLEEEVEAKRFRQDLYYRLNVISLTLPPLRERREDIAELGQSYVDYFRVLLKGDVKSISEDALAALIRYRWPGNLRELINAIERAVIMTVSEEIQVEDLPLTIQEFAPLKMKPIPAALVASPDDTWLDQTWSQVRRQILEEAELRYLAGILRMTHGRIGETAQRAGMDPRSVRDKMRRYKLKKEDFK